METKAARGLVETSKVEENVGLHGSEERESSNLGGLVEELGSCDLAVLALVDGSSNDELDKIHFSDHVLERTNIGV